MELSVQTQTLTFDYIEAVIDRLQNSAVSSRKGDIKMIPKPEKLRDKCVSWMCLLHLGKKKYLSLLQKYPHHRNNPETKHA